MYFERTNIFHTEGASHYRIPSIVVTKHGTALAFCTDRRNTVDDHADEKDLVLCRREKGGEWSPVIRLASMPGWSHNIQSAVYDEITDTVIFMASRNAAVLYEFGDYTEEERKAAAEKAKKAAAEAGVTLGRFQLVSRDDGLTFTEEPCPITPTVTEAGEFIGSTHGSAPGIQLKVGKYAGRLLCPARYTIAHYTTFEELRKLAFNNAIWSDDHGKTWHSSGPVQAGTGEGTLIERADGTILYNSRAYFRDGKRYLAVSRDGGETYGEFSTDDFLEEETHIGCNASFLRVDTKEGTLTLFANPRAESRKNMTVCVSRDDGASWFHTKQVDAGMAAYSALAWSPMEEKFILLYEHGEEDCYSSGLSAAIFDLEWLLSE